MAEVAVTDVKRSFDEGGSRREVLRGISFDVAGGELVALLGRSGSGKSTLLNLIAGIDRPDDGQIVIDGCAVSALDERARTLFRRARIGFVFQFFNLISTLTVEENVRLPLELGGARAASARAEARRLLQLVELGDRGAEYPDHLSGGEQQRVAIARALVHAPAIVLADEPTGALDAETGRLVLGVFVEQSRRQGTTVILVTHSDEVARAADRVLVMKDGRVASPAGAVSGGAPVGRSGAAPRV
jgi:putative ABC transport system ATP-binding protein